MEKLTSIDAGTGLGRGKDGSTMNEGSSRRGRTPAALVAIGVLGVALAGCGGAPTPDAGAPTTARPTTSPTPPPMSPSAYQNELATEDAALKDGFTSLAGAQDPQTIAGAATAIDTADSEVEESLAGVRPPAAAATGNADLVAGLTNLTAAVDAMAADAQDDSVCLGSSALALLSRSDDLTQLRTAITELAAADPAQPYHFGTFLPPVTQDATRSVPNGTIVAGARGHGLGRLKVTNGGDTDATLGLVLGSATTPVTTIYLAHGASYTLSGVRDGSYTVYVTSGEDWDAGARLFSRSCGFQKFDSPLDFATTSREYTVYTLTLTPVPGGTATESDVDPGAFPH
jgi:hypothetical protein